MAVNDLGIVRPGSTILLPFNTFDSNDPSASVTLTGLALADIGIYKGTSMTERASTTGVVLLDTDGIDIDATTGIHGLSIDLSSNATAGFYEAGSQYYVTVASVTVDAATVNFVLATFRIGYPGAIHETSIAAYTSTDNFTLTVGSADDDAYNGCILIAHDVASAIQTQVGIIEDYTGSTKTVNLKADPGVFTMTAADNISIFPPALNAVIPGTMLDVTATGAAGVDWGNVENKTTANDLSGTDIQLADTVTTLTGHTPQTGDSFARIGVAGAGLTNIDLPDQTMNITGNLSGSVGSVTAQVSADMTAISGDATAADNLELMYDGTGYTDDAAPATQAQVGNISSTGGAALAVEITADNASAAIVDGVTKVGTETGTFANLEADDGSYHQITHATNAIDWVYKAALGSGFVATSFLWKGYLAGQTNAINVQAWNGSTWDTRYVLVGQAGSANVTETVELLSKHTDASGDVYLRFVCSAQTSPILYGDLLTVQKVNTSRSVGYALGAIWLDTANGTAGTTAFVNGVADNPTDTIADVLTLSSSLGLKRLEVANGSTVTLAAAFSNWQASGSEWTLALGGQAVASSAFHNANVSGTGTGADSEFVRCRVATASLPPSVWYNCTYTGTMTMASAGDYLFKDCASQVAGASAPTFDFGTGPITASFRNWSGGITLSGLASGDVVTLEGTFGTITLGGADATVEIRGSYKGLANNLTGSPSVNIAGAWKGSDVADILTDTADMQPKLGTVTDLGGGATIADNLADAAGATFSTTTDSLEAIRNRGDAAWTTGAGGTPPQLLQSTTIATLASQTSFTLTAGSADDDAYNNAIAVITDQATATQKAVGTVSDYTGSTKTVTLAADPAIYTMATGDTIEIIAALGSAGTAPTAGQVADAVWDEVQSGHVGAGTFGEMATEVASILVDTAEIGTAGAGLTDLGGMSTAMKAEINVEADTAITDAALATAANLATVDTVVDAIKVTTDKLDPSSDVIMTGTASGTPTTTTMVSDIGVTVDDQYKGRTIIFKDDTSTSALRNQATDITACTAASNTLTFTALTTAPSSGDTFIII